MDLTHSLPSILSNIMTDYLPPAGFKHAPSPALEYALLPQKEKCTDLLEKAETEVESVIGNNTTIQNENNGVSDRPSIGPFSESVTSTEPVKEDIHRIQFYASNDALKLPLVSPIFDRKHLRGLPPILVVSRQRRNHCFDNLLVSYKNKLAMWCCRKIA